MHIGRVEATLDRIAVNQAETAAELKKTIKVLKEQRIFAENMNRNINGISKSNGLEAEEFFYSSLRPFGAA